MIALHELLHHIEVLRTAASVTGRIPPCFYEVKVVWENEFFVRIVDCPPNISDQPPRHFTREHTGNLYHYARAPFQPEAPLEYMGQVSVERLVVVTYEPVLDRYTLTEVEGPSTTYRSLEVLSHAIGIVNSTSGENHDHVRTVGRALLRDLTHNAKRHSVNFRSMAHLIHQFHREINVLHDDKMALTWCPKHQMHYRHFKLMHPARNTEVPESHVYGLVRSHGIDIST